MAFSTRIRIRSVRSCTGLFCAPCYCGICLCFPVRILDRAGDTFYKADTDRRRCDRCQPKKSGCTGNLQILLCLFHPFYRKIPSGMSFDLKMTLRWECSIRIRGWIHQSVDCGRFWFLFRRFFQLTSVLRNQCLMHFKWFWDFYRCFCLTDLLFLFHLDLSRTQITSCLPFPVALFSTLLFDLFLCVYRFCVFFRSGIPAYVSLSVLRLQ